MRAYEVTLLRETGLIPTELADYSQSLAVLSLNIYRFYYLLLGVKHVSPAAEMALVGSLGTDPWGCNQSERRSSVRLETKIYLRFSALLHREC